MGVRKGLTDDPAGKSCVSKPVTSVKVEGVDTG